MEWVRVKKIQFADQHDMPGPQVPATSFFSKKRLLIWAVMVVSSM